MNNGKKPVGAGTRMSGVGIACSTKDGERVTGALLDRGEFESPLPATFLQPQ